jgi:solute carrier family 25 (peroxisomal adenine nucleotide transporter), member 17
MIAGAIAGSATVLLTNPIWVVNTRMTARSNSSTPSSPENAEKESLPTPSTASSSKPSKPSTIATLRAIVRDEGVRALFSGVLPALVLVINPILQYTIFEQLKNALETRAKRRVGPRDAFLLGALGKLLATSITYPYITVKSRAHVAKAEKEGDSSRSSGGSGLLDGLRKVVREEGWQGLYGGIGPKVTQSVITAAFLFAFKDVLYEASVKVRRSAAKVAPA